ncbi:S41 family peptidase [Paenibacillus zanthoxyli]|uniref:hypothetical protein n=1 Tax=Paenibacillus zanthoxyli TaxID=369399 RepID=UPI000471B523|nr:hypothetical protein [Paenibacillus zanthoxyli]
MRKINLESNNYLIILNLLFLLFLSSCSWKEGVTLRWEPDLKYVKQEMMQKEISLKINHELSITFGEKMDRIIEDLPKYENDDQVKIELSKAVASIGQLHTSLELGNEDVLPFILYMSQDKLYVIDTLQQYSYILFAELTEINHQPVERIVKQLKDVVSRDNEQGLFVEIPSHIVRYSILHGLGVIEDHDKIPVTFLLEDGSKTSISVPLVYQGDSTIRLINPYKENLFYKKLGDTNYEYKYLPRENTLYAAYNSCYTDPNYSIEQYSRDIVRTINHFPVKKIIIDLRNNRGGNSDVIQPLVKELSELPKIKNNIIVLIGRYTASSAMANAIELRSTLNAILIGEPANGDPNKPGDILSFRLHESGLTVNYSTKEFHLLETKEKALNPDILVNLTISDIRKGVDPVLTKALEYTFN